MPAENTPAGRKPVARAVEHRIDHGLSGANRRVGDDEIKRPVHVFVYVRFHRARVFHAVSGEIFRGQRHRALVHVRHQKRNVRVFLSQQHAHRAPAAAQIERAAVKRRERLQKDARALVQLALGEHARVRLKRRAHADALRFKRDRPAFAAGLLRKILFTHASSSPQFHKAPLPPRA